MEEIDSLQRRLVARVARALKLERSERDAVAIASLLHDGTLLEEPLRGDLRPDANAIDFHVEVGAQIAMWQGWSPDVAEIIRHHHEHYDGSGKPNGLAADEIPIGSYILALTDEFRRLTTTVGNVRPIDRVLLAIRRESGTKFHPHVAAAFLDVVVTEGAVP